MKILNQLTKEGLHKVKSMPSSLFRLDNLILGKSIYTMKYSDKVYEDMNMSLALLERGYGFSYFQSELDFKRATKMVNKDVRELLMDPSLPIHFQVTFLDAVYSQLVEEDSSHPRYLTGDLRSKAKQRADAILEGIPNGSKVTLLGAVTEIIEQSERRKLKLSVFDLEPSKIGDEICNKIIDTKASKYSSDIHESSYIIASGMTCASDTIDELFEMQKECGSKLIFYMETGSNYGRALLEHGANRVVCEKFPFYDFNVDTKYFIYENNFK